MQPTTVTNCISEACCRAVHDVIVVQQTTVTTLQWPRVRNAKRHHSTGCMIVQGAAELDVLSRFCFLESTAQRLQKLQGGSASSGDQAPAVADAADGGGREGEPGKRQKLSHAGSANLPYATPDGHSDDGAGRTGEENEMFLTRPNPHWALFRVCRT